LHHDGQTGNNKLLFSNRTAADIILKDELKTMLGDNLINTLTQDNDPAYDHRKIDAAYLQEKVGDFSSYFYICGPDPMVAAIKDTLLKLGAAPEKIVTGTGLTIPCGNCAVRARPTRTSLNISG